MIEQVRHMVPARSRREFLCSAGSGLGALALAICSPRMACLRRSRQPSIPWLPSSLTMRRRPSP